MSHLKALAFVLLYVTASAEMSLASGNKEAKSKASVTKNKASQNSTMTKKTADKLNAKLGTSFKFDGSSLRGKFQSTMGTAVAVENDKYLDDLLSGRKHFEDRLQEDNNRN